MNGQTLNQNSILIVSILLLLPYDKIYYKITFNITSNSTSFL